MVSPTCKPQEGAIFHFSFSKIVTIFGIHWAIHFPAKQAIMHNLINTRDTPLEATCLSTACLFTNPFPKVRHLLDPNTWGSLDSVKLHMYSTCLCCIPGSKDVTLAKRTVDLAFCDSSPPQSASETFNTTHKPSMFSNQVSSKQRPLQVKHANRSLRYQ